jgi:hypothetical protein
MFCLHAFVIACFGVIAYITLILILTRLQFQIAMDMCECTHLKNKTITIVTNMKLVQRFIQTTKIFQGS